MNSLSPDVKRGDWTAEEDATILRLYHQFGPKWTLIAQSLPGRTDNAIKNRFYASLRKNSPALALAGQESEEMRLVLELQQLEMLMSRVKTQMEGLDGEVEQEIDKIAGK